MTAPPVRKAPPRSPLPLAATALTCCLAVYVVAVPLVLDSGSASWPLALLIAVAAIAAIGVLVMLSRLRHDLDNGQAETARYAAWAAQLSQKADQQAEEAKRQAEEAIAQADRVHQQDAELGARAARNDELTAQLARSREREQQLTDECAQLRSENARLVKDTASAATEAEDRQDSMRAAVVALSRRVQSSAHRLQEEATLMADRHPGNTDVLEVGMRVDHAAAQQARTAQSMAVLLGEWPGQQWPDPLPLVDVVRAAAGRIIAYQRIEVAGDPDIAASPSAVEPLIHLVAELLANATQSSPPTTQVPVTVRAVQRGAVIEVHDCGVGLDDYRLERSRAVAAGRKEIGLEDLGEFPQTGLAVVGQYVRRHGFRVDISESVYGGVRAIVGIPTELTETVEPAEIAPSPVPSGPAAPVPGTRPAEPRETQTADDPPLTRENGLPRRVSPRHATAVAEAAASPAPLASLQETDPEVQQPSPEEAAAWMGAFLTSQADGESPAVPGGDTHDNSTGQQEQQ